MNFLSPRRRKAPSADKLRVAYADLLQHIDVVNANLGRRAIDKDDADIHKKSKRFSFRRNVIPQSIASPSKSSSSLPRSGEDNDDIDAAIESTLSQIDNEDRDAPSTTKESRDLAAAFRMMAATRSPDKEGGSFGTMAIRDDSYAAALSSAKAIESRVVDLIRNIGEIVLDAEGVGNADVGSPSTPHPRSPRPSSHVRSDPVFEYFCEKSILSLLVDIAKEKRQSSEEGRRWGTESCYHGVVWSPLVKAQVFSTVASLVADGRNRSVLYYLLSHNYINELIQCVLPLQQWTDQALSKMVPAYVDMMQKVAIRLADDPQLFPFLTVETEDETPRFPLFSAVLETATGSFAQSDSIVYGTCLLVTVNIMQISYEPIQNWIFDASSEQCRLADHLCQRLLDRYYRIINLTTGPIVDGVRSNAIAGQLSATKDHMAMIHEVFWSGVRGLDVRLCESLLQRVVTVLMKNLLPSKARPFLVGVGMIDTDVIPEKEALAQVSTIFLGLLFSTLSYVPFQRMLAVALFHEKSTPLWSSTAWLDGIESSESYILMPLLSDIVTGDHERETCPNLFRSEIIDGVSGKYGEWRTIVCAGLVQTALNSEAMDDDSLRLLGLVPDASSESYEPTELEIAIAEFLERDHDSSAVVTQSLEHVGLLAIQLLQKILLAHVRTTNAEAAIEEVLSGSPVWRALLAARKYFATAARKFQTITGVSDIFLDLVESAISNRYIARYDESGVTGFRCSLAQRGSPSNFFNAEILVRRLRSVSNTDVETCRFHTSMTLHFRALCKVVDRYCAELRKALASSTDVETMPLDLADVADELTMTIGGLAAKPKLGTDLDLTGRMTFRFQSVAKPVDTTASRGPTDSLSPVKALSEDRGVFRSGARLIVVLDPADIFVVREMKSKGNDNRGTILCHISLRSVIAAADDEEWLHVAVRHEDVGCLIKNGNMAFKFENSGASKIVKQYLERSREVLRLELLDKVSRLLGEASTGTSKPETS